MTSRIDYGPDMLALFLQAHVMFAGVVAATKPFEERDRDRSRIRAEREYLLDLAAEAGVKEPVLLRAMKADRRLSPVQRLAVWRAMDIDPHIHEREAA